jgi:hypothetical protein
MYNTTAIIYVSSNSVIMQEFRKTLHLRGTRTHDLPISRQLNDHFAMLSFFHGRKFRVYFWPREEVEQRVI